MKYVVYSDDRFGKFSPSGLFNSWSEAWDWSQTCKRWATQSWVEAVEVYDLAKYQELETKYQGAQHG
jgi:hypothetical protein